MSRNHHNYLHNKAYVRPNAKDVEEFWSFRDKLQRIKKRSGPLPKKIEKNSLGVPVQFHPEHCIPFVCLSSRESNNPKEAAEVQHALSQYVQFKTKQSFNKLLKMIQYKKELPIYKYKDQIVKSVLANAVTIIAGDTGCGKSTQVPQYLLEAGFNSIACTQPRRIACVSLAARVGHETFNKYGHEIGYQVRFDSMLFSKTKLRFLTEGLLLRQLQNDPSLYGYDLVILDEVHERHLHCDLLLGILKGIVSSRPEIRIVLMSATLNLKLFSDYFPAAPLISIPGRVYPVEVRYCPTNETTASAPSSSRINPKPYLIILQLIDTKYPRDERGDLLIFASGLAEIMTLVEAIREYNNESDSWIVLPLHSSLSVEEQQKVFDYPPAGVRKCIIATNIAETSLTIDGVRFIIDSGKFKEMAYDPVKKLQKLTEFWVSKSSAEQRKGRAGRTGPGVCFRLYSEKDFSDLVDYPTPEILRMPLDSLILQLVSMGVHVQAFPFLEKPPERNFNESLAFLQQQGALKSEEELSPIGEVLARLPVDVPLGKLLFTSAVLGVLEPALTIAAGLNIQSAFNKSNITAEAAQLRALVESKQGDLMTLLNIYEEWTQLKSEGGNSRRWCKKREIKEQQLYEMTKLRRQFRQILRDFINLGQKDEVDEEQVRNLRRLKWQKKLEEPSRKVLKLNNKERESVISSDSEGETKNDEISTMEYFLTNPQPNLDLSRSVKDTLNFISMFGLYPNFAISDKTYEDIIKESSEEILAYGTLLETNKPYLTNLTRAPGLTTCLLVCKEVSTNATCTDIICDMWLRFTVKDVDVAEGLVHGAVKLRHQWATLVRDVLQRNTGDERAFRKRQVRFQRKLSSYLRTEVRYTLRNVKPSEISSAVRYGSAVKLDDNITINAIQGETTGSSEAYIKRPWKCSLCGESGLFSIADKKEHLASCGEDKVDEDGDEIGDKCDGGDGDGVQQQRDTAASQRKIPTKAYRCDICGEEFQFTNIEILRHVRQHG